MAWSLELVQEQLRRDGLSGWLLYVLQNRNPVAEQVLGLPGGQIRTRRAFYYIPAQGTPVRLEHLIESKTLAGIPGLQRHYLSYDSLCRELARLLDGADKVAMEISPLGAQPAVSLVDAGTVDLVRSLGVQVLSSADLAQGLIARLSPEQIRSHLEAAEHLRAVAAAAFEDVARAQREERVLRERELQAGIMARLESAGLVFDHPPIVASGPHAADPHHEPGEGFIGRDQVLLIDLWARHKAPGSVYADQTWMGFTGRNVPEPVVSVWELVRNARRAVRNLVSARMALDKPIQGWEADEAARRLIREAGHGERFIHRTGHSIDEDVHGRGANLDNLETREERRLIRGTIMSVEPGVYLDDFGVRSEYDLVIDLDGEVRVAEGTDQEELILMA